MSGTGKETKTLPEYLLLMGPQCCNAARSNKVQTQELPSSRSSGQGGTEYLVLLGVVLVLTLVTVSLSGGYPDTAKDASVSASKIYWQSQARPISVQEATLLNESRLVFNLENTEADPIILTGVRVNGQSASVAEGDFNYTDNVSVYLSPGEKKNVNIGLARMSLDCAEGSVSSARLGFDYKTQYGTASSQNGDKRLLIICNQNSGSAYSFGTGSGAGATGYEGYPCASNSDCQSSLTCEGGFCLRNGGSGWPCSPVVIGSNFVLSENCLNDYACYAGVCYQIPPPDFQNMPVQFGPGWHEGDYLPWDIEVSGGISPYSITVSGDLPSGLSFTQPKYIRGVLAPGSAGAHVVRVQATDSSNPPKTVSRNTTFNVDSAQPLSIEVTRIGVVIDTIALSTSSNAGCSDAFILASGGKAFYSWSISGLPPGTNVSNALQEWPYRCLQGRPTATGTYLISVTVTDADSVSTSRQISTTVN